MQYVEKILRRSAWALGGIAFVVVAAFCALILRPLAWWQTVTVTYLLPHFGEFAAAGFGALLGSASAFYLGLFQQRRDRRDKQHEAALAAQYALQSQWNILEGIRRQLLEPLRNEPLRHTKLPLFEMSGVSTFVPFKDLIFIAKRDDPNLLQEIRIAEDCYRSSMQTLQARNGRWEEFLKNPRIAHRQFNPETGDAILEADSRDVFLMKKVTDALYRQIDRSIPMLATAFEALQQCIKRTFPKSFKALRMIEFEAELEL